MVDYLFDSIAIFYVDLTLLLTILLILLKIKLTIAAKNTLILQA